jgi:acyl carrier protein
MSLSRQSVIQSIVSIIENELPIELPSGRTHAGADLRRDLGLDSVLILDLIGAIEEKFDFEFDESDLEPATFETIETLASVVRNRLD